MNEEAKPNLEPNLNKEVKPRAKKGPLFILIGILLALSALIFCYWFFDARFKVGTNDAYVEGNIIEIYPKVSGTIRTIAVNDTDHVLAGQVLVTLDPTTFQIKFDESLANLGNTLREVQKKFDTVSQLLASLEVQLVNLEQAKTHYFHRRALVDIGGVSREDFENAQSAYLSAEAEVVRTQEELSGAEAQVYNTTVLTHPLVKEAIERVKLAWLDLINTKIRAPYDGFIAKKGAQVGEVALTSQSLLAVVPLDDLWVTANLKENKLSKIRIGQEVKIKTDLYKNQVTFSGKVIGISPGTGSIFSILPPQNATGNWIKIVQRVPVRISLNPSELKNTPLRAGLSTTVSIDVRDEKGAVLTEVRPSQPLYKTEIYDDQLNGVSCFINQIIEQNLGPCNGN